MDIATARVCPRKAFLREKVPSGVVKAHSLRAICKHVLLACPPNTTKANLRAKIDAEFAASKAHMFGFEAASEADRMETLLWRYLEFEKRQRKSKILAQDFSHKVKVMGKEHTVSAHRLVDRGDAVECIRYQYTAPKMTYGSKLVENNPQTSPDLLALQRCGEAELKKQGINKPVFGSFYYMKSKGDRNGKYDLSFEGTRGHNVVNNSFLPQDETEMERLYAGVKADPSKCSADSKDCNDCRFNDLCHAEFVKRALAEMEAVEETPLDQIRMTKSQRDFVAFDDGQCRVNAVAGSGKTTIVTLRTLRLIEEGCPPEHILMITFTEKAKEEMRSRLRRYAKGSSLKDLGIDTDKIVVETFNSFGQKLLDDYFDQLGFTSPPSLVDEIEKKDIIVELLESHRNFPFDYKNPFLDMFHSCGAVVQMSKIIDAMKANHVESVVEAEEILGESLHPYAKELLEVYDAYNAELVKRNAIDYEDQLRLLLRLKPYGVFGKLPYEHIVVDEFQDSDRNQINLILEMAREDMSLKSIVVVGDELQAIYGFRNANPDNLVNFGDYFPQMIDIPLEENFRSQSPIIAMANRILSKEARIAKVIKAQRQEKGLDPVVKKMEKVEDEQLLFVKQTIKLIQNGTDPKDIAILCRTKSELLGFQKLLEDAGVPTILRVPEIIGNAPYVKAIIGLAAFLLNHDNVIDLALYRKSLGLDPFDADAVAKEAEELAAKYDALTAEGDRIQFFLGMVKDASDSDYIAAAFMQDVLTKGFHTAHDIFTYCVKYRDYGVKDTKSTAREDVDAVSLITVHSSKGLEWPVVLLSLRKFKPGNDEEHRLLYVAVTRAKEKLLITHTQKQTTLVSLLS